MSVHVVKVPDVGEGVAEVEIVGWHVAMGDIVELDAALVDIMTDKATVDISAPVAGVVTFLGGEPGQVVAVGSDLIGISTSDRTTDDAAPTAAATPIPAHPAERVRQLAKVPEPAPASQIASNSPERELVPGASRPPAAPVVRRRALDLGIELAEVSATGPAGRVLLGDLDRHLKQPPATAPIRPRPSVSDEPVITPITGLRRRIAERMSMSASSIPHISYIDDVDLTDLEALRRALNERRPPSGPRLTVLPFVMRALMLALREHPRCNSTFDEVAEVLTTSRSVHVGIATQTDNGLVVPVVHDAQSLDVWGCATELNRVTGLARAGTATRSDLSGSTITITSLGPIGGLAFTPIINMPEVAILGVNKIQVRPVWNGSSFAPRSMMNLSSSFDHRILDGWDAATFVQSVKQLLEVPALLFVDKADRD